MLLQGRRIMEHLPSLLTIQGSRLVIVPAAHPVRRASASMTISIPVVEAVARARILHNFLQTHQRFSNNGFKQRKSQQNQTLLFIRQTEEYVIITVSKASKKRAFVVE
ncbi:MAG: hypothetical protein DLM72_07620 [Candidatus Nitrosopolaris wilkensis]|nr:MAG: hypothetical protein DLM72_07620 [Candidatus Nitrosopolaris wilkensis]